jgi:transcriptional regulator with XRE-family HTH domain
MTDRLIVTAADWIAAVEAQRKQRGWTYADVEDAALLGEGYYGKLVLERKTPTLPTLQRLLGAVGLSLALTTAPTQETHQRAR